MADTEHEPLEPTEPSESTEPVVEVTEPAPTEPTAPTEPAAPEAPVQPAGDRELDVVLFGATGFVGKLVARYLAEHAPADLRVGLAGRSLQRLESARAGLGPAAQSWPLVVADAADADAVGRVAQAARVVATTVGPYAKYGLPLVRACAAAGTDYVDLTGEVLFVRDSMAAAHDVAARTGARIVHSCGFDSIPSDLGVLSLHEQVRADGAGELTDTTLVVKAARGGFSGGTIDSLRNQVDVVRTDPSLAEHVADPYAMSPDRAAEPQLGEEADQAFVRRDPEVGGWTAPFVMAQYNTRIVRRSNALQGWAYGRTLRYREVIGCGDSVVSPGAALAIAGGTWGAAAGLMFGPARWVLDRVLPSPGSGPSERAQRNGYFRMEVHTRTTTGRRYVCTVAAQGDPGYAATAMMMGESALCLALDRAQLPAAAGVLTPASAMGTALLDRLRRAGMTFDVASR
ncbi:saccharopine dehydrogenase NADP-binding domain-containing protein [Rhodococcus sp. X156]|uniref:saccharopine dehydrogenase family protein n=1 Tax=Rhodococcus sp. X156 TaxID=2499145 RepID=UPI000FD9241C|nr:saccharopine dehydrogenase NADP-binding domain-containing protein [Rhodococcus sp. X156]